MVERWDLEPDWLSWRTEAGYPAFVGRNMCTLALCGYVGMPLDHPYADAVANLTGVSGARPHMDPPVHGGVTFDSRIDETSAWTVRWLDVNAMPEWAGSWRVVGFDCAHGFDYLPKLPVAGASVVALYRTVEYVMKNCEALGLWFLDAPSAQRLLSVERGVVQLNTQPSDKVIVFEQVEQRPVGTVCFGKTNKVTTEEIAALPAVETLLGMGYPVYYRIGKDKSHVFVARDAWDKWDTIMASRGSRT